MKKPPVRRFFILNGYRLDELHGLTVAWARSHGRRIRGVSFSFLTIGASLDLAPPDQRSQLYRELERIIEYLLDTGDLGSLATPGQLKKPGYMQGHLSMFSVPFTKIKPAVQYMVGETDHMFVALGAQLKDVVNRGPDYAQAEKGAPVVEDERDVVRALARARIGLEDDEAEEHSAEEHPSLRGKPTPWEKDLVDTYRRLGYYEDGPFRKKDYEILAYIDDLSPAEKVAPSIAHGKGVLLGKPLFVAYDD